MTETLTRPMTRACKPPATETFCGRFWRRLLYAMAHQALDQFADGVTWNNQAREAYLQALKGDRYALETQGSANEGQT